MNTADISAYLNDWVTADTFGGRGVLSSLALDIRFGYAGYRWDQQLHKYHARHRVYDPATGRWLNRDPAEYQDSLNLYEFVVGSPLMWRDPMGLGLFRDGWEELKDLTGFGNPDKDYKEMMDRTNQMQLEIMLALCLDPADFHDLTDFQELDAIRAYQRKRTKETAKDILETIIPLPGPSKFRIIKKLINKSKKLKKFLKRGKKLCKLIGAGTFTSAGKGGCGKKLGLPGLRPDRHIGPSKLPKFHGILRPTRKRAEEEARKRTRRGLSPIFHERKGNIPAHYHANPKKPGSPHFFFPGG